MSYVPTKRVFITGKTDEMPLTRVINRKKFYRSALNPMYLKNCTAKEIRGRADFARKEGWLVRVVRERFGDRWAYVIYERRSPGQKRKMIKMYGRPYVKAIGIVLEPEEKSSRRARRR
jgi:hypothetical protein